MKVLRGMYHERVAYPSEKNSDNTIKEKNNTENSDKSKEEN